MSSIHLPGAKILQDQSCRKVCCAAVAEVAVTADFGSQGKVVGDIVDWRSHPPVHQDTENKAKKADDDREGLRREVFLVSGMDCGDCAAKLEKRLKVAPGGTFCDREFRVRQADDRVLPGGF